MDIFRGLEKEREVFRLTFITRIVLLGHQPTLPQIVFLYACLSSSMLAGASIAHTILKPDLTIPEVPTSTTPLK